MEVLNIKHALVSNGEVYELQKEVRTVSFYECETCNNRLCKQLFYHGGTLISNFNYRGHQIRGREIKCAFKKVENAKIIKL